MLRPHNQYIRQIIARGEIGTLGWAACGAALGTYHQDEGERQGDDVLSEGKPSIVTAEHAMHVIDIIESAYRASATGQSQVLRTTMPAGKGKIDIDG
jgi:hypothetical protein